MKLSIIDENQESSTESVVFSFEKCLIIASDSISDWSQGVKKSKAASSFETELTLNFFDINASVCSITDVGGKYHYINQVEIVEPVNLSMLAFVTSKVLNNNK